MRRVQAKSLVNTGYLCDSPRMSRPHRRIAKGLCNRCTGRITGARRTKFCSFECSRYIRKGRRDPHATDSARFYRYVNKGNEQECGPWTGQRFKRGPYGKFAIANGTPGGRKVYAHRFSYESVRGPIPAHLRIDHTCRNKLCQNPLHMQLLTNAAHSALEHKRRAIGG